MAALFGPVRKRHTPSPIVNHYVEDGGKRYRVCMSGTHVLLVGLKCRAGGERLLDPDGRRFRQIAAKVPQS